MTNVGRVGAMYKRRSDIARRNAMVRHAAPGGSHEMKQLVLEAWASGDYATRDACADKVYKTLGIAFRTARNYLVNAPDP